MNKQIPLSVSNLSLDILDNIKEKLFRLIKEFVKKAKLKGIIDIDIFKVNGEYYISEVNPRFGGGYPHAYECGVNVPKMIINNIGDNTNNEMIGKYEEGIYMMKYNEVKIKYVGVEI